MKCADQAFCFELETLDVCDRWLPRESEFTKPVETSKRRCEASISDPFIPPLAREDA